MDHPNKKSGICEAEFDQQANRLKELEEELNSTKDKLNLFFDKSPDMVYEIDYHGPKFIRINDTICKKLGYSREELMAKDPMDILDEESKTIFKERITQSLAGQKPPEWIEYTGYKKNGQKIFGELNIRFTHEHGRPKGAIVVAHDITRRKQAEQSIIESRNLLNSIIDSSANPIYIKDCQSRVILANSALGKVVGKPLDHIIGKTDAEYLDDPQVGHTLHEHDMKVIRSKTNVTIEETVPTSQGYSTFISNKTPYYDVNGNIIGIIGISHDITERKKFEEALKEAKNNLELKVKERTIDLYNERQRLYQIFETMPVMVCLLSADHKIPYANKAFRDKFGESEGRCCYDYCFGLKEPCDFCESFNVFETGKPHHWECETKGNVIDVHDFPFVDIDGTKLILEIDIDITEFKQAQKALGNMNELLEKKVEARTRKLKISNKELEQFAYVASHDLQEPLRMISSFTQLLEKKYEGELDSDADEYIKFILDGSHRMKDLINDLLTYSRLNSKERKFQYVDLNELLDDVLQGLKPTIMEEDAHITTDKLPVVHCDPTQIGQLFQNLISNSIKFHQTTPRIHISAEETENEWILGVSDEGIGIDSVHHEKIFDVFKRLHTREEYAGTGIGLAICKKIVEKHNGRIWVESEPEQGANFYFTIPKPESLEIYQRAP